MTGKKKNQQLRDCRLPIWHQRRGVTKRIDEIQETLVFYKLFSK